jgi:hypothetical protein
MRRELKIKDIFVYILSGITLIFEFYFGIISGVWFVLQVILLSIIFVSIGRLISNKSNTSFFQWLEKSFFGILAVLGFFLMPFLLSIVYYTIFPGKLSDIIISNGKQKIVFMQMSHIATHEFYESKKKTIDRVLKNSPVFLIEWVRSWTDASQEKFDMALGVQFDKNLYETLASLSDLEVQSGGYLLDSVPLGTIKNVDMSMDEIVSHMSSWLLIPSIAQSPVDITKDFSLIEQLSTQERSFIAHVFRAFLNWSIINMTDIERLTLGPKAELFDIILNKRNQKVIDFVLENPSKDIVIMYGALHFTWIYEALKSSDKNWKIESYTSYAPYSD